MWYIRYKYLRCGERPSFHIQLILESFGHITYNLHKYTSLSPPLLTCVRDESLQVGSGALVLQQLLGRQVREEHLQDGLSIVAVSGVGVPHHAVAQQRL